MRKKKLLFVTDSCTLYSGLGRVCRELAIRFCKEYNVAIAGWHYQNGWHGLPFWIYHIDKQTTQEAQQVAWTIGHFNPDIVLCIGDPFYFQYMIPVDSTGIQEEYAQYMRIGLKQWFINQGKYIKWVLYTTIDGDPIPWDWGNIFNAFDLVIPCTEYGKRQIETVYGKVSNLVYLGIDAKVYHQFENFRNKEDYKRKNGFGNKFVVLVDSQNTDRHNIMSALWAYNDFAQNKENVIMWLNTDPEDPCGALLRNEIRRLGLQSKTLYTADKKYVFEGITGDQLNAIYNFCDVLVRPSKNEGFGLPLLQAFATGVIPIGTNYSSIPELIGKDRGFLIPVADYTAGDNGIRTAIVSKMAFTNILNTVYNMWQKKDKRLDDIRHNGEQFALDYSWDRTYAELKDLIAPQRAQIKITEPLKVGIMTSWNEECGIGIHTKMWADRLKLDKTIFSTTHSDVVRDDEEFIKRNWNRWFNDYSILLEDIDKSGINVLHIQHEHSFFSNINLFIKFLEELKKRNIKTVITLHSVVGEILNTIGDLVDVITVASDKVKSERWFDYRKKCVVIPHAVNPLEKYNKFLAQGELGLKIESNHIMAHFGFVNIHKGILETFNIVNNLIGKYKDIHYLIIGKSNDQYEKEIERCIRDYKLKSHVTRIAEFIPDDKVGIYMQCADVIVYNYLAKHVSTSAAILQGIASHRPCLCSDSPMLAYFDGEVEYFRMGNDLNFTQKADQLFENEPQRKYMVWKAEQYVKKHTPERIAGQYEELYKSLVG